MILLTLIRAFVLPSIVFASTLSVCPLEAHDRKPDGNGVNWAAVSWPIIFAFASEVPKELKAPLRKLNRVVNGFDEDVITSRYPGLCNIEIIYSPWESPVDTKDKYVLIIQHGGALLHIQSRKGLEAALVWIEATIKKDKQGLAFLPIGLHTNYKAAEK